MRTVAISAAALAAFLLGLPDDASAAGRGGRGSGHSHAGRSHHSGAHHFHGGARTRIFIAAPLIAAPLLLYPRPYYAPAPIYYTPPVYQEREPYINPDPSGQYWYYCPVAGAYYPYVGECPGGWQRVVPNNVPPPPAG
jgi:hypothetical protein